MSVGTDLCQGFESYAQLLPDGRVKAYWDKTGKVWTIGWGSTGADVGSATIWTRETADSRFQDIWNKTRAGVLRASPLLSAPENYNRLEAVTCFAYNVGTGAYNASTMKRKVNAGAWQEAAEQFPRWKYSGGVALRGLVRRRAAEQALFLLAIQKTPPMSRTDDAQLLPVPLPSTSIQSDPQTLLLAQMKELQEQFSAFLRAHT